MTRSLNTAGTGMVAQQFNLDTIANNLANVNTTSFKQQRAEFSDLFYQTFKASGANSGGTVRQPITLQIGLGSKYTASSTNFARQSSASARVAQRDPDRGPKSTSTA